MATDHSPPSARRILLGTIATAHGIRGEVMLRAYTDDPEAVADYGALTDQAGKRTFKIRSVRATPKGLIARLEGVSDRDAAEALRGTDLYVDRRLLPETEEQVYYHADLIGLEARDTAGAVLGEIVGVANFGAGDLLEIRKTGARQTEYLAFTHANVPTVDVAGGHVVVDMPDLVGEQEPQAGSEAGDDDGSAS
ncbi:MAG TPA: ribosome maturation factor RimM [Hyphomicrobium sp.]|nr:ribosome maturation factor RimM [Hyphomicrobium sp.]